MRTKYIIDTHEKARNYHAHPAGNHQSNREEFELVLDEAKKLQIYASAQRLWAPHVNRTEKHRDKIEPRLNAIPDYLMPIRQCTEILRHFANNYPVKFYSSKTHEPIEDLNKTSLPSKYIVMEFTDHNNKTHEYPLDSANRVELRKNIENCRELMRSNSKLRKSIGKFLDYMEIYLNLDEIEKSPVSKKSQKDSRGRG